ncbi:MAG: hypothetical protein EA392_02355 [Cryomorphaceae bacterium]|nr:MAG: hypothetical protein EA392_02355 [Cryomorphaceae bacterium]
MRKLNLSILMLAMLAFGFTSCKKCLNCSYVYEDDHGDHSHERTVELPEVCGSNSDLDKAEQEYETQFNLLPNGISFTCARD